MHLDKKAFLNELNRNKGIIRSLCLSFYSSAEDQNDAFQDIVLQLWKSRGSFRGQAKSSTWIYKVGLNALLSKRRKEQKAIFTESIELESRLSSPPSADDDIELLQLLIRSLPDVDKALVILYLEGYKNREIADLINLSASNVGTRLNRIKAVLKQKFKTYCYESGKL